jgi:cytochrome oxidase Cu insertion factor (SCO1/SenC/PrrC family)
MAARIVTAAALAAALLCAAPTARATQDEAARLMNELMSGKAAVGAPFTLTDADGRKRRLADFRGKVVLLYFGYTFCPDVCPTDLMHIAAAIRSLGAAGDAVQPLFVTLDPARDTPELLRRYSRAFHPRFIALRGSETETRRVARAFKVYSEKVSGSGPGYLLNHAAFTFMLDREGRYVSFFPPGTPGSRMAPMIREQLAAPAPEKSQTGH